MYLVGSTIGMYETEHCSFYLLVGSCANTDCKLEMEGSVLDRQSNPNPIGACIDPYICSFMCIVPLIVIHKLKKILRAFLWGHDVNRRGLHLFSWSQVCSPKSVRRLGFQTLFERRQALQGQLAAQVVIYSDFLWAKLVSAKYHFSHL